MADLQRILHIDDSEDDRLLFERAFKASRLKAELLSFSNAFETLIFLDQAGTRSGGDIPRLIVLDLTLPLVDGRHLLSHLRANARYKRIPIVVLTGSNSREDVEYCRDFEVERYIIKPSTLAQLSELMPSLEQWLGQGEVSSQPWRR
jgi:chemotaxis family two-component system response regulator Rcp1